MIYQEVPIEDNFLNLIRAESPIEVIKPIKKKYEPTRRVLQIPRRKRN